MGDITSLLLALVLFMQAGTLSTLRVKIPRTSSQIMIDGNLSAGEWQDARRIDVPGVGELYFQESGEFIYIAVKYTNAPSGIVDLYLSPRAGEIYDLHASAKLGERHLLDNSFPEWSWWNNRGWVANVSRVDSFEKRTFLPTTIREFQIRRSRFASSTWLVHFELTTMSASNEALSTTVFPSGTNDQSTAGWIQLDLQ